MPNGANLCEAKEFTLIAKHIAVLRDTHSAKGA